MIDVHAQSRHESISPGVGTWAVDSDVVKKRRSEREGQRTNGAIDHGGPTFRSSALRDPLSGIARSTASQEFSPPARREDAPSGSPRPTVRSGDLDSTNVRSGPTANATRPLRLGPAPSTATIRPRPYSGWSTET